jgi:hypothetical protein
MEKKMPKTVEITCDLCERDITRTTNCEGYRLALVNERMPTVGGFVTAMAAYPAIERDAYFCGVDCLAVWLADKYPTAKGASDAQP